jgi:hypothetical protein
MIKVYLPHDEELLFHAVAGLQTLQTRNLPIFCVPALPPELAKLCHISPALRCDPSDVLTIVDWRESNLQKYRDNEFLYQMALTTIAGTGVGKVPAIDLHCGQSAGVFYNPRHEELTLDWATRFDVVRRFQTYVGQPCVLSSLFAAAGGNVFEVLDEDSWIAKPVERISRQYASQQQIEDEIQNWLRYLEEKAKVEKCQKDKEDALAAITPSLASLPSPSALAAS